MQNDITSKKEKVVFGNDSVVIRKYISGIPGGRTLDVSDFEPDTILAGHVIIKKTDGNYAPMPINGEKYAELPGGASYAGVLYRSISKENPAASIMYDGVVNPELVPYQMTDILEAFKTACPHIIFEQDEEA